ncbi:MAG: HEAT repeat domain-containing protein [Proteobacteria bacterium]|nr:HEAT repeat domain-containing protein [Pseudomonadota bacterium]
MHTDNDTRHTHIVDIAHKLRQKYEQGNQLERFSGQKYPITQSYINLVIVSQKDLREQKDKRKEAEEKHERGARLGGDYRRAHEALDDIKESIDISALFRASDSATVKKVMLYGSPGVGKSISCRYVAVCWQEKILFNEFGGLIMLPLREMLSYSKDDGLSLEQVIIDKCIGGGRSNKPTTAEVAAYLDSNADKLLFILDGYDEVAQAIDQYPWMQKILQDIITTPEYHVIMTSRPMSITKIGTQDIKFDRQVENMGFTSDNIKKYVHYFYPEHAAELLEFFEQNPSIRGIAHIPINLDLICNLWKPSMAQDKAMNSTSSSTTAMTTITSAAYTGSASVPSSSICSPTYSVSSSSSVYHVSPTYPAASYNAIGQQSYTTSQLYDEITRKLLERYVKRNGWHSLEFNKYTEHLVQALEKLALAAMCTKQIIIQNQTLPSELKLSDIQIAMVIDSGLVKLIGNGDLCFLHLTFQEYYVASSIARDFSTLSGFEYDVAVKLLQEEKYNPYYEMVWCFTAGILYGQSRKMGDQLPLLRFWDTFERHPREILGIWHTCLRIKLLEQCKIDISVPGLKQVMEGVQRVVGGGVYHNLHIGEVYAYLKMNQLVANHVAPDLAKALNDQYWDVMMNAATGLSKIGRAAAVAVPFLMKALKSNNAKARSVAARVLSNIGPAAAAAVPALIEVLKDKDKEVRSAAAYALGNIGPAAEAAVLALIEALNDEDWQVPVAAAHALGKVGSTAVAAVPALVGALKDWYQSVRHAAACTLDKIGPAAEAAIPALIETLKDHDAEVRYRAAQALGGIGPAAVPALIQALKENKDVGPACALGRIGQPALVPALIETLKDHDAEVRYRAAYALSKVAPSVEAAILTTTLPYPIQDHLSFKKRMQCYAISGNERWIVDKNIIRCEEDAVLLLVIDKDKVIGLPEKVPILIYKWQTRFLLQQVYSSFYKINLPTEVLDYYLGTVRYYLGYSTLGLKVEAKQLELTLAHQVKAGNKRLEDTTLPREVWNHYTGKSNLWLLAQQNRPRGYTSLHDAAAAGNLGLVKSIVVDGGVCIDDQNNEGEDTALILAAKSKHWEVVRYLVEQGADVTRMNKGSDSALSLAFCTHSDMKWSEYLIKHHFMSSKLFKQLLHTAVSSYSNLTGYKVIEDLVYNLTRTIEIKGWSIRQNSHFKQLYRMYLEDITAVGTEHAAQKEQFITIFNNNKESYNITYKLLSVRLYIYTKLYVKLRRDILDLWAYKDCIFPDLLQSLETEIKYLTETIINYRLVERDGMLMLASSSSREWFLKHRAEGIIQYLINLKVNQEYIISAGYQNPGHAIYVSLHKLSMKEILIRVDNRWLFPTGDKADSKIHKALPWYRELQNNPIPQIKSCAIAIFQLDQDHKELEKYVYHVLNTEYINDNGEVLSYIYGTYLNETLRVRINNPLLQQKIEKEWQYHNIQADANRNCILSSYNLGLSTRISKLLFNQLQEEEMREVPRLIVNTSASITVQQPAMNISSGITTSLRGGGKQNVNLTLECNAS